MGGQERRAIGAPGYDILERIGGSDGADVYLAEQKALGRRVALKVLHADGQGPEDAARFEFETRTASELMHPNIVPLLDSGTTEDGHRWYAMPHFVGGDLSCRVVLPPGEVRRIALALCEALWYAHSRNVVHRDIKPTNVLFDDTGRPMLADFGIATSIFGRRGLTLPGRMLGSARYISPEQARGEKVDPRADLYSLGVVIYEMLIGHPPFDGADDVALARQHASAPVPRLPAQFAAWQGFFERALAKAPAERYLSARTMAQALDLIEIAPPLRPAAPAVPAVPAAVVAAPVAVSTEPTDDLPQIRVEAPTYREATRVPARRPPRWPFAVLAAGVLAVVALVAYALTSERFEPVVPAAAPASAPATPEPPQTDPAAAATVAKPVATAPKPATKPPAAPASKPASRPPAREVAAAPPVASDEGDDEAPADSAEDDAPEAPSDAEDFDDEASRDAADAEADAYGLRDDEDAFDDRDGLAVRDPEPGTDPYDADAEPYGDADAPPQDDVPAPDFRDDPAFAPGIWTPPIGRLDLSGSPRRQLATLDAHVDEARNWLEDERYRVDQLARTLTRSEAEQEFEEFAVQEQAFERWLDRMGALRERIVRGE